MTDKQTIDCVLKRALRHLGLLQPDLDCHAILGLLCRSLWTVASLLALA